MESLPCSRKTAELFALPMWDEGMSRTFQLGAKAKVKFGTDGAATVVGVVKPDANGAITKWVDLARRSVRVPASGVPWWFSA